MGVCRLTCGPCAAQDTEAHQDGRAAGGQQGRAYKPAPAKPPAPSSTSRKQQQAEAGPVVPFSKLWAHLKALGWKWCKGKGLGSG